jgi:glycine cleavage system H protein
MSDTPDDLRYAESHEWVRDEGDGTVTIGISDHAQAALGDVVYVELPEIGRTVTQREEVAVVESVKAASDIYAPIDGEVIACNEALTDGPELINSGPYADGWMFKLRAGDPLQIAALLDSAAYAKLASEDEH